MLILSSKHTSTSLLDQHGVPTDNVGRFDTFQGSCIKSVVSQMRHVDETGLFDW